MGAMTINRLYAKPEHVAYVAVVEPDGFGVGIASADELGYTPFINRFATMDEAQDYAEEANNAAGITATEANAVQICSMFRPGEYAEVLAQL